MKLTTSLIAFALLLSNLFISQVQASLLISPTRLVFAERDRSKDLILINTSNKVVTYRLEWQEQKALPEGGYAPLSPQEQAAFNLASPLLRFTPRQVTLQPGERQTVKVAARKPSGLANGEYRSFLLFNALPPQLDVKNETDGMSINLNLILSYSLPVILRQGQTDVDVRLDSATLSYDKLSKKGNVRLTLNRKGSASAHLNALAYWTPSNGGAERMIARTNAYNVYPELDKLSFNLSWLGESLDTDSGMLRVVIEGAAEYSNRVFADTKLAIGPGQIKPLK